MKSSKLELAVGTFVLVGLAAIVYLALKIGAGALIGSDTYVVKARFSNIGGLNTGSSVVISGVTVGRIESISLDQNFAAIVELRIRKDVQLPSDTIASIRTSGLIGDKFLALSPGGDEETIPPGGLITETESAVDLESLISRFAFGNVQKDKEPAPAPSQ
ncbi:MAG: outer membrane lipid asymmetry maintenance protein MlaD [Opitutus sp.]|nr:outer membrane lipid asymmetry maintenance protein MlaD [Opitutus sp.]